MQVLRWVGRGLLACLALGALALGGVYARSEWMLRQRVTLPPAWKGEVTRDSATVARGEHLARSWLGCVVCHGENLGGRLEGDVPWVLRLAGPNLTTGARGVLSRYSDAALEAAIRHGVGVDGRKLFIMPSYAYAHLADDDLAALIAYIRTRPAVDGDAGASGVRPLGRVLMVTGAFKPFAYDKLDHTSVAPAVAPHGITREHGEYVSVVCKACHGATLTGGKPSPGAEPGDPVPPNLTIAGLGGWSEADFVRLLRTGVRPDGRAIRATAMPWPVLGRMSDEELGALWTYLRSLGTTGAPVTSPAAR